jgi:hypothetical protein
MSSFKLQCAFCLLILCLLGLLLSQSLITYQASPPARIADLHELAVHLRQKGMDLRGVSSRGDGLWLNTIYLTNTDKKDMEIRGLAVHPSRVDEWKGTVIVFSDNALWPHHIEGWGENCLRWNAFLFFGDKEILMQIAKVLNN